MADLEPADNTILRARRLAVRVVGEAVRWAELIGLVLIAIVMLPLILLLILIEWILGDD